MNQYLIKLKTSLNSRLLVFGVILFLLIRSLLVLLSPYQELPNSNNYYGRIDNYQIKNNTLTIYSNKLILKYYLKDNEVVNVRYGDYISVNGSYLVFNQNTVFGNFNTKVYRHLNNQDYYFKIEEYHIIKNRNIFYQYKNKLAIYLKSKKNSSYYMAFVMGDKTYLDDNLMNMYQINGITHLLAISGMHLGIYVLILNYLLKQFKLNELFRFIVIMFFMIGLLFITNNPASLLRALILYILMFLNKRYKLFKYRYLPILYTLIILLIFNKYIIFQIGFIYSFLVTLSLTLFDFSNNKLLKMLEVPMVAILAVLPLSIYLSNTINILSIFINFLIVPFVSFLMFPLILIGTVIPFLDGIISLVIHLFNYMNETFYNLDIFIVIIPNLNILEIIVYYFLFVIFILNKKKLYLILLFLLIVKLLPYLNPNTYVYYLNVGQGDSSVLISEHYKTVTMIDTGGNRYSDQSFNYVVKFLHSKGISKIDNLIITHGDFDHMGDAVNLINIFRVKNVIFNCGSYNDLEKELMKVLEKKKIKYYSCISELNINMYKLQFLNTKEYDNENDNSNVIFFKDNNTKFLFMGDAGIKKEGDILEKYNLKNIYFLKVGHHGSNTSSSKDYVNSINPKYSLISVGKNNRYGHPKDEVLDILKNSKIYRTDLDGSIEIKLNKNGYKIRTCPP